MPIDEKDRALLERAQKTSPLYASDPPTETIAVMLVVQAHPDEALAKAALKSICVSSIYKGDQEKVEKIWRAFGETIARETDPQKRIEHFHSTWAQFELAPGGWGPERMKKPD